MWKVHLLSKIFKFIRFDSTSEQRCKKYVKMTTCKYKIKGISLILSTVKILENKNLKNNQNKEKIKLNIYSVLLLRTLGYLYEICRLNN